MEEKLVTEKEAELIDAIRSLKNSMHNPSVQFELYVRQLVDEILKG